MNDYQKEQLKQAKEFAYEVDKFYPAQAEWNENYGRPIAYVAYKNYRYEIDRVWEKYINIRDPKVYPKVDRGEYSPLQEYVKKIDNTNNVHVLTKKKLEGKLEVEHLRRLKNEELQKKAEDLTKANIEMLIEKYGSRIAWWGKEQKQGTIHVGILELEFTIGNDGVLYPKLMVNTYQQPGTAIDSFDEYIKQLKK